MSLFGMENFAFGDVADPFDATQTSLNFNAGDTDRFTVFPAMGTLWNLTDYANAHEAFVAGDAEIIEIDSKDGDTFDVIKRGQDGTIGIATTPGSSYRVAVIASRSQWDKVCRAQPDGGDGFDAILAGVPGAVANQLARFVKNVPGGDAVFSIQGSGNNGDETDAWLGSALVPDRFRINFQALTGSVLDRVRFVLGSLDFLTLEGRDRMGIRKLLPAQPGGIHVGQTMVWEKHIGFPQSDSTISGGQILDGASNFIRVEAEGGPGSDDLDEILLVDKPQGSNRMILIIEPRTTAHNITVRDKFVAGGSANLNLRDSTSFVMNTQDDKIAFISRGTDNDEWVEIWRTPLTSLIKQNYVLVRDEKASGTDGGTFTSGAWQTRDINTEETDTDNLATVSSNQIILQPGTYRCDIIAPAVEVLEHKLRLQNITDATTELIGTSAHSEKSASSILRGLFTIAVAKTLEVQHQAVSTKATIGFGRAAAFGVVEVYTVAEFQKLDQ